MLLGSFWLELAIVVGVTSAIAYYMIKEKYKFFRKRNLTYKEPLLILGSMWKTSVFVENIVGALNELYREFSNERLFGIFQGLTPAYVVRDPEIINRILIKDFSHFHDRGFAIDEETNPLEGHLFNMSGMKWKTLRNKLTPTFTSGKLKGMYSLMDKCVDSFIGHLDNEVGKDIEIKDALCCLTTDVIGSCAFGIDSEAIKDPNCQFRQMGKRIFDPSLLEFTKNMVRFIFPEIFMRMKLKTVPKDINEFFFNVTEQNFSMRLKSGQRRNDFMQLLLELREKGEVSVDPIESKDDEEDAYLHHAIDYQSADIEDNGKLIFTDNLLTAQAFVFFAAGFETSATSLSFVVYLLSKYTKAQDKLREEVREVKNKYGGFTYDAIKSMKYLEACINEGMRMYPAIGVLFRKCNKTLHLGDGLTIEKGLTVFIPNMAVQNDPTIFPEPDVFKPERFIDDSVVPGSFIPFGDGPRVCIAQRFALVELKLALAKLVDRYYINTCDKMASMEPLVMNPRAFILQPKGGIYVNLKKV